MKYVAWVLGILIAIVLGITGLQLAASERVEVVELHTADETGEMMTTRLWIVDLDGDAYLRGDDGSGWVERLKKSDTIELTRGGESIRYQWEMVPGNIDAVNKLMREKYTWGDDVITMLVGSREASNAIRLTPAG